MNDLLKPGQLLKERYLVERELGHGGMGLVYLAHDEKLHSRKVVIKILREDVSREARAREHITRKFRDEKQALAALDHPHIVGILDAGELEDGQSFLVMQHVEGETLAAALQRCPHGLELWRVAEIARQMGHALTAAHNVGIVHRDLKPQNVMLHDAEGDEIVKIIDFGIASVRNSQTGGGTDGSRLVGTLPYMAPEQLMPLGKPAPSIDIWAFGVIAYEMVTGRLPFRPTREFEYLPADLYKQQERGVEARPASLRGDLPAEAEEAILQALAYDPQDRFRRARDFGDALARSLGSAGAPRSEGSQAGRPPIAHVLALEVAGFAEAAYQDQARQLQQLQAIVMGSGEYGRADAGSRVLTVSRTGGMLLVFWDDPQSPLRCALEVARRAKAEGPKLRMGAHTGPVYELKAGRGHRDAAGAGVNVAQRLMQYGQPGHVLLSKTLADFLIDAAPQEWKAHLHDLGECSIDDRRVGVVSFVREDLGNPERPAGLLPAGGSGSGSATAERRAERAILTRVVSVAHRRDARGREELLYTPAAWADVMPEPAAVSIKWSLLQGHIEDVRARVEELTRRALRGDAREGAGVEAPARELARHALPPGGFAELLGANVHPQLDIVRDAASEIPWEVLDESYSSCPKCQRIAAPSETREAARFCQRCGSALSVEGGRLAIRYHLAHVIRGQAPPGEAGRGFVVIEDPTLDLTSDEYDRAGTCRAHIDEICALLKQAGYDVEHVSGKNANSRRVLAALCPADVPPPLGVYYFGHGYVPRGGDEGCLLLADGPLPASRIEEAAPAMRFVFLNACEGASAGRDWDLEKRHLSVAGAFAKGGSYKVVIAPLWPVVNVQAAETALQFFRHASTKTPCGDALLAARRFSLLRYDNGEPHLGWMAYRYFGDPNRPLPTPVELPAAIGLEPPTVPLGRVFNADWQLDPEVFAFAIDEVLLRAARRRNEQGRRSLSPVDFVTGLLRRGDLTRFVVRRLGADPDVLHDALRKWNESEPGAGDARAEAAPQPAAEEPEEPELDEAQLRERLARFIVRDRKEFHAVLASALRAADLNAQRGERNHGDRRVSEREVLAALLHEVPWEPLLAHGLPTKSDLERALDEVARAGEVDDNGQISLATLDADARKIVETAHQLAQQRGIPQITNRLLLAAFLGEPKGYAATRCRELSVDPEMLSMLMIALSEVEQSRPTRLGLSSDACNRIVLPVIEAARGKVRPGQLVGEKELFQAFCEKSDAGFKAFLRQPPMPVDLDELGGLLAPAQKPLRSPEPAQAAPPGARPKLIEGIREEQFEPAAWTAVSEAARVARAHGFSEVRTPHLYVGMLGDGNTPAAEAVRERVRVDELKRAVLALVAAQPPLPDDAKVALSENAAAVLTRARDRALAQARSRATAEDLHEAFFADGGGVVGELLRSLRLVATRLPARGGEGVSPKPRGSLLDALGEDLTAKARRGELPTVVGRDADIDSALQTLLLLENANPLLVGEAGVGKTAIVEGIAQRIASGRCPNKLTKMRIIELSAGALLANTRFRGDFEQRMQALMAEARGADVILFIDEIHTLVGAGGAEGASVDAGNMLKTALARGELRLIGATTDSEHRRTIAKDPALSRRFQVQRIQPPSRDATIRVLVSRQKTLEAHHGVRIGESVLAAAVDLSGRYVLDKQWPAKARDVLERACVLAVTETSAAGQPIVEVSLEHVARVVSRIAGVPVDRVSTSEMSALATLELRLNARIIGQTQAVHTVAEAIRRGRQGLADTQRPWGVFLFLGPPGVGKTELAKAIAEEVYGGAEGLIRFDMGDFGEAHSASRLVGAPPGYVGYEQGAPLVERLRARPYSLLLFDEIEHAHENVLAVLLRLFSEGTLADADGTIADARNAIVVLTSNVLDDGGRSAAVGFARDAERSARDEGGLRALLEGKLPGKLIDRLDALVRFNTLTEDDLARIASLHASDVVRRVGDVYGVSVEIAAEVPGWLAEKAASESPGARAIKRAVDAELAGRLGAYLGRARPAAGAKLRVVVGEGALRVEPTG
jgi:ATP-dependent Clp protease ATP-binding subunit ClpC